MVWISHSRHEFHAPKAASSTNSCLQLLTRHFPLKPVSTTREPIRQSSSDSHLVILETPATAAPDLLSRGDMLDLLSTTKGQRKPEVLAASTVEHTD